MTDIYVGNLNNNLDEKSLEILFKVFGEVISTTVVKDRNNGPKCYGFVKMENDHEAQAAIDEMDGRVVASRRLNVHKSNSAAKASYNEGSSDNVSLKNNTGAKSYHQKKEQSDYSLSSNKDGWVSIKFGNKKE